MPDAEFDEPHSRQEHPDYPRARVELECVGSFTAHTQNGESRTIEIWTRFGATHDRSRSRVAPGLIILTTTDGYDVEYVAKGHYRLHGNPGVELTSSDRNAP